MLNNFMLAKLIENRNIILIVVIMKRIIDSSNWNLYLSEDISSSVLMWQKTSIMEQCIPRKTLTSTHCLPWLTKSLLKKEIYYLNYGKHMVTLQLT